MRRTLEGLAKGCSVCGSNAFSCSLHSLESVCSAISPKTSAQLSVTSSATLVPFPSCSLHRPPVVRLCVGPDNKKIVLQWGPWLLV